MSRFPSRGEQCRYVSTHSIYFFGASGHGATRLRPPYAFRHTVHHHRTFWSSCDFLSFHAFGPLGGEGSPLVYGGVCCSPEAALAAASACLVRSSIQLLTLFLALLNAPVSDRLIAAYSVSSLVIMCSPTRVRLFTSGPTITISVPIPTPGATSAFLFA